MEQVQIFVTLQCFYGMKQTVTLFFDIDRKPVAEKSAGKGINTII